MCPVPGLDGIVPGCVPLILSLCTGTMRFTLSYRGIFHHDAPHRRALCMASDPIQVFQLWSDVSDARKIGMEPDRFRKAGMETMNSQKRRHPPYQRQFGGRGRRMQPDRHEDTCDASRRPAHAEGSRPPSKATGHGERNDAHYNTESGDPSPSGPAPPTRLLEL